MSLRDPPSVTGGDFSILNLDPILNHEEGGQDLLAVIPDQLVNVKCYIESLRRIGEFSENGGF